MKAEVLGIIQTLVEILIIGLITKFLYPDLDFYITAATGIGIFALIKVNILRWEVKKDGAFEE